MIKSNIQSLTNGSAELVQMLNIKQKHYEDVQEDASVNKRDSITWPMKEMAHLQSHATSKKVDQSRKVIQYVEINILKCTSNTYNHYIHGLYFILSEHFRHLHNTDLFKQYL